MKPTVIKVSDDDHDKKPVRPTIIPTVPTPDVQPIVRPHPTTIVAPVTELPAKTRIIPTEMPGKKHTHIQVTTEDLRTANQQIRDSILERARQQIFAFDPTDSTDTELILWGQNSQIDYSNLVSRCLKLSEDTILVRTSKHVSRLQDILGGLHLKELLGIEKGPWSLVSGLIGGRNAAETLFVQAQVEISQLITLLQQDLPVLLTLKTKFEDVSREIEKTGDEVQANAIAALFLADYIIRGANDDNRKRLEAKSQILTQRSMSLTQTLAQIRGNSLVRDLQIKQPLDLVGIVQNVVLVMVPAWLSSYTALKSVLDSHRKPTQTEVDELGHVQTEILDQLRKGKG